MINYFQLIHTNQIFLKLHPESEKKYMPRFKETYLLDKEKKDVPKMNVTDVPKVREELKRSFNFSSQATEDIIQLCLNLMQNE